MLILQEGGNRGNWGEWRVFGGILEGSAFLPMFFFPCTAHIFRWYTTYPSTRVGFSENIHAYSPADGITRLASQTAIG